MKRYHSVKFLFVIIPFFMLFILCFANCGGGSSSGNALQDPISGRDVYIVSMSGEKGTTVRQLSVVNDYSVSFSSSGDWGSGFTGSITVKNTGTSRINNWQLEFDFDRKISGIWNAVISNNQGKHFVVSGESWNSYIEPGKTVTFGFQGNPGSLSGLQPSGYILRGEGAVVSTPVIPVSQGDIQVAYKTDSDWGSGFTGGITLTNKGSAAVNTWSLQFDFSHSITSIWNAKISSKSGNTYVIMPESYTASIPAGGSVSFGFCGSPGNVTAQPSNVSLTLTVPVTPAVTPSASQTPTQSPSVSPSPEVSVSPTATSTSTPSPSPSPTATQTPSAGNKRVVAYFAQWGIYARNYLVTDIPADKVTHINYAFFGIDSSTGGLKMMDSWADIEKVFTGSASKGFPDQTWDQSAKGEAGNLGRLKQLKALYPNVKTMISVGGWTLSYNFPDIAGTAAARQKFAESAVSVMKKYDFDGIDIDWEYPGSSDRENFTLLMQALRNQLDKQGTSDSRHYLLSFAGPAGASNLANIDLKTVSSYVDYVNIMTYDFHGGWETTTNHVAPLYLNPNDPQSSESREQLNSDWVVNYYINNGMAADKINLGVPFYGRAWEETPAYNNGLFQSGGSLPNTGTAGNWEAGVLDYWKICELLTDTTKYKSYTDSYAKVPWVYGKNMTSSKTTGGMFVTYENPDSAAQKVAWIKAKNLGGVMIWELSGDVKDSSSSLSLLGKIFSELNK
ncbi:MAG: glycosyl hydrolase family 18 protein [Firmicutes bacterium]|nr:glycosyl hydrolase family 18 protein [Bacillota bacterium]